MTRLNQFGTGMLAGGLCMLAAFGGHWLVTPARHPDSTAFQHWATVAGVMLCVAVSVVLIRKHR